MAGARRRLVGRALGAQAGVLFGLDARIALGIFATISLIAGAVVFSRIDTARQAVLLAELEAIHNALSQYQADMGTFFLFTLNRPDEESTSAENDLTALWDTTMVKPGFHSSWHGPYLHRTQLKHPQFGTFGVVYATADRKATCTVDSDCSVWLTLSGVPAEVWGKLNTWYDEAHGKMPEHAGLQTTSGRVQADSEGNPRTLYFRTIARPNTP